MKQPTNDRMRRCPTLLTALQKNKVTVFAGLVLILAAVGCASTRVANRERLVNEKLTKPGHILVHDFTATPAGVPTDSMFANSAVPLTPPSAEQAALIRELGAAIAAELVTLIREMRMPAVQVSQGAGPQLNDIVIRGYFVSIDQGSAAKRMTLGFGSGESELTTAVEGFQMTASGLRKLGSGTTDARGSKGPGSALGAAGWLVTGSPIGLVVTGGMKIYGEASGSARIEGRAKATAKEIADELKLRFQEEGWID